MLYNDGLNYRKTLNSTFIESIFIDNDTSNKIKDRLLVESLVQGLIVNDIAEINNWTKPKTSKIITGAQLLSMEDIRVWSRSLGYTPESFIGLEKPAFEYFLSEHIRSVNDSFYEFLTTDDSRRKSAIFKYEIPLAMSIILGIKMSEYVFRFSGIEHTGPQKKLFELPCMKSIRFHHRIVNSKHMEERVYPEIGVFIGPENQEIILCLYLRNDLDGDLSKQDMEKYTKTNIVNKDIGRVYKWIPKDVINGEIMSVVIFKEKVMEEGILEKKIIDIFYRYCSVFLEIYRVSIITPQLKKLMGIVKTQDMKSIKKSSHFFSTRTINAVKSNNKYSCEIDEHHSTFLSAKGEPYLDIIPLIPFSYHKDFGDGLSSEANAVCLCPMCKSKIMYGRQDDKEEIYYRLYKRHKQALVDTGVEVSLQQVLEMNGL